jgi:hypothetical protein
MASTVKTRLNHYEVLGLAPGATDADIAHAFAREASPYRPRPIGELAQVTLAFETLRDPARRRAYDASLAPKPEPKPEADPAPSRWERDGWPFVASARVSSTELPSIDTLLRPIRRARPEARPEPLAERRAAPFVAAPPKPEEPRRPAAETKPRLTPLTPRDRALEAAVEERLHEAEDGAVEWKRPALIAGALLAGAGLLGAWAGWEAGDEAEAEQPEQAVTLEVPQAEAPAPAPIVASPPAAPSIVAEARPARRTRDTAPATARIGRAEPPPQPKVAQVQQAAEAVQLEEVAPEELASEIAVVQPPAAAAAATTAKLPLPDSVVARTIRRIGYACGQVASATAVDGGAPGVFKVTCTSGDSYRAAPVRGRYHFRRWGRD